jgi:hypothetical protein
VISRRLFIVGLTILALACDICVAERRGDAANDRYLLLNLAAPEIQSDTMRAIKELSGSWSPGRPRVGVGAIISYFRQSPEKTSEQLRRLLSLCEEHELAVIVQLDGEQWWMARPDLWNWWDKDRPGYNPANAANVEWSGWGPEHALKIAWRNWGKQYRVQPPPNLMSPRYRDACHAAMEPLVKEVVRWRDNLPEGKRWLLVGVKVGWESAIGMGSHYYRDGNSLLDKDPADDPDRRAQPELLPGRGYQPIGYAAVLTAGLAHNGELKEEHLAEIVRRHLDDLSAVAHRAGLPRDQIFTHCGGWAAGERLYRSAVNENSCPGWSFYRYGRDPLGDTTAMTALAASDAPSWAATEWLPIGARTADDWRAALRNTLAADRCRYVCIYNWRKVKDDAVAQAGIRSALAEPLAADSRPIPYSPARKDEPR